MNKICAKCRSEYPSTKEFWYSDKSRPDGFHPYCKICQNKNNESWKQSNPKKKLAYSKKWRDTNPDKQKACRRAWRLANRKKSKGYTDKWRKAHPEKVRAYLQSRRAKKRSAQGEFTGKQIEGLLELQKGKCWWRGSNCAVDLSKGYHIDHRIALARGGTNDISNIVLSCPFCNTSKGTKMPDEWIGRLL